MKWRKNDKQMKIEKIKIELLTPYENNAKEHPQEQIDQIKQSILTYGMNDPIGVWGKQNIIVEGHGRVIALQQLGYEEVECIRLDHLSEEERKAYTLIHNKLTMNTDFNFEKLEEELKALTAFDVDMSLYGFDDFLKEASPEEQEIVETAREYIMSIGGFEKFAE
jgi:ParB-like chromosome segregation protein Spo0J